MFVSPPVIKVSMHRYHLVYQTMTNNLNQSPSCFAAIKLSPHGELKSTFDLKMEIWACVGEHEGRRLCELPCKSHCDAFVLVPFQLLKSYFASHQLQQKGRKPQRKG